MKVCVIGLGRVGLPTAQYVASKGMTVYGYDISKKAITKGSSIGIHATKSWSEIPTADVYIICTNTMWKSSKPDLTAVFEVCEKVAEMVTEDSLVSIESTVVPGTCRKINEDVFKGHVALVHVPHRYWAGDPIRYGVKQRRVIGAVNEKGLKKGINFYRDKLEIPLHMAPSIEVAEMSKIAENVYRYVQIAFAEELKMVCEECGLNFEDVRSACNTKWNIEMLEAREGIKNSCLPKDIRYYASLSTYSALSKGALFVDKVYQKRVSKRLE